MEDLSARIMALGAVGSSPKIGLGSSDTTQLSRLKTNSFENNKSSLGGLDHTSPMGTMSNKNRAGLGLGQSTTSSGTEPQNISQNNRGIFDLFMKPFTVSKYGQERHARSLDPFHLFKGYNFVGPGTELRLRNELYDADPVNSFDAAAKKHDNDYAREGQEYNKDLNKNKHMEGIWQADRDFMKSSFMNKDDPIMGTVAAGLIGAKMLGEKLGLMSTNAFSGIDSSLQKTAARNKPNEYSFRPLPQQPVTLERPTFQPKLQFNIGAQPEAQATSKSSVKQFNSYVKAYNPYSSYNIREQRNNLSFESPLAKQQRGGALLRNARKSNWANDSLWNTL